MNSYYDDISKKYYQKGIIVDTNILLLTIIGNVDKNRIQSFKRTKQFVIEDYLLLSTYLKSFDNILTTPQILTEINGFLNQLDSNEKEKYYKQLSELINSLNESYKQSSTLSSLIEFKIFGLTDTSIYDLATNRYLVLTDDLKLTSYLSSKNIDVINFNNIRTFYWDFN